MLRKMRLVFIAVFRGCDCLLFYSPISLLRLGFCRSSPLF